MPGTDKKHWHRGKENMTHPHTKRIHKIDVKTTSNNTEDNKPAKPNHGPQQEEQSGKKGGEGPTGQMHEQRKQQSTKKGTPEKTSQEVDRRQGCGQSEETAGKFKL